MTMKETQMTAKFIDDFKGYATKYENPNWDIYDTLFSEYLSAIGLIMDRLSVPKGLTTEALDAYRNKQVQTSINYLSAVLGRSYTGHTFSFNDSYLLPELQGNPSTFAYALECILVQGNRTIMEDNMGDLKIGVVDRAPVDACSGKNEYSFVMGAIHKMNDLAYEDEKQFPEMKHFNPSDYLTKLNVSSR